MSAAVETLPDSRCERSRKIIFVNGSPWVQLFCASCHTAKGGIVPEEECTFAFYLCEECAAKYGDIPGHIMVPDEVFFQKVREAQIEKYGHVLQPGELAQALDDPGNPLRLLAREAPKGS